MTDKAGEFIRHNWPVIAAVLAAAMAWGTSTAQLAGVASTNERVLAKVEKQSESLAAIQANLAGLQATNGAAASVIADLQLRLRAVEARR